jgi:calreticulin
MIDNPAYKGPWIHPEVANPDFKEDPSIYKYSDIGAVGFELWQVKAGTIFDNIIVSDSVSEAEALLDSTWGKHHDAEKAALDAIEKVQREKEEAERAKIEAERKAQEATKSEDDEDDEDDDDEDAAEAIKNKKAAKDEL